MKIKYILILGITLVNIQIPFDYCGAEPAENHGTTAIIESKINKQNEKYSRVYDIDTDYAHFLGKQDAKLSLIVFLDYQCPYCTSGYEIYKALVKEFPEDLKFVFMHNPLDMHRSAVDLAGAAEAAGEQGKFFEMSDILMHNKGIQYSEEKMIEYAKKLNLDIDKFKKDLINVDILTKVFIGQEEAKRHQITATPTVILNKKMIRNNNNLDYFKNIIQEELKNP